MGKFVCKKLRDESTSEKGRIQELRERCLNKGTEKGKRYTGSGDSSRSRSEVRKPFKTRLKGSEVPGNDITTVLHLSFEFYPFQEGYWRGQVKGLPFDLRSPTHSMSR